VIAVELVADSEADAVARATGLLDGGELAVVPTDGAYALCGDALNDEAALRIFHVLGRSADQPLPVIVGGFEDIQHVAFATPLARRLADAFWPGPLTLVLRARPWIPDEVTANAETVQVRVPGVAFTRSLARHFGPLAAPDVDAADARRARDLVRAEARLVVDAGARTGKTDTLVDATGEEAKVLREGAIRAPEVEARGR
jgi:L-threonylcarbamoyladenylate synthase